MFFETFNFVFTGLLSFGNPPNGELFVQCCDFTQFLNANVCNLENVWKVIWIKLGFQFIACDFSH